MVYKWLNDSGDFGDKYEFKRDNNDRITGIIERNSRNEVDLGNIRNEYDN